MLVGGVIDDELGEHSQLSPLGFLHEAPEIRHRAEIDIDGAVVRNIIAVVTAGRGIERQQLAVRSGSSRKSSLCETRAPPVRVTFPNSSPPEPIHLRGLVALLSARSPTLEPQKFASGRAISHPIACLQARFANLIESRRVERRRAAGPRRARLPLRPQ